MDNIMEIETTEKIVVALDKIGQEELGMSWKMSEVVDASRLGVTVVYFKEAYNYDEIYDEVELKISWSTLAKTIGEMFDGFL